MTEQYSGERFKPWNLAEGTVATKPNDPAVNWRRPAEYVPAEAAPINEAPEAPMDETPVAAGPVDEAIVQEAPMAEMMPYKAPEGEPVADESVASESIPLTAPMGETIVHEVPIAETVSYSAPAGEPPADEPAASESIPLTAPVGATVTAQVPVATKEVSSAALLGSEESERFRTRWNEIQGTFVDEPRSAVQQADALVTEVVEQLTKMFANEHSSLESQWNQGNDVSTEDLRKALQRYRSFFKRLVV